jgi:outer membrane protein insertion porin family
VGLQLDPESSLAGILRYTQANVGGTGQTIGIDLLQATTGGGPSITLDYSNPFIDDQDTVFRASVYSKLVYRFAGNLFGGNGTPFTNNSVYDERHTGTTFGVSRPISDDTIGQLSLRAEYVDTEDLKNLINQEQTPNDPTDDQMTNNFIQQYGFVGVGTIGSTTNRRDVDVDPSRGDYFQVALEPGYSDITKVGGLTTGTNILGPNFFTKAYADYRVYWTPEKPRGSNFDAPRKVVAFRARYGTTFGEVPFFEQFFAGGSDTLRGYPDDRYWGRQQLLTSVELRYPIQKSFSLIGFVDYGGAWGGYGTIQGYNQSSSMDLHLGFGPGVSFRTPLGNIQLFLGFNPQGGTQTHFLIGNSF